MAANKYPQHRIWLPYNHHLSVNVDKAGWQVAGGFGRLDGWGLAVVIGWNRWPHLSFGSQTRRIGLGEWQTDPAGSVHGLGPFWFTRPPTENADQR